MKCFNHNDVEAIGTCHACSKGICKDCVTDLGHSICCKNSCEEKAELLEGLVNRSAVNLSAQKRSRYITPVFFAFMGSLFIVFGLQKYNVINLSSIMGLGFVVFAIAYFIIIKRWANEADEQEIKKIDK